MLTMSKLLICQCHQHRGGARWKVHRLYLALKSHVRQSKLHRPPIFASPGTQEQLEKGRSREGNALGMWGSTNQLPGGDFAHPITGLWEKALHLWCDFGEPFPTQNGHKCGAGSAGEVRWLSQPHQGKQLSGNLWTNEQFFSVMLLGDITVVNHKTINCCYSGIFLINTSILKSISVKLKLLMGSCQFRQKLATKPTLVKISQIPDEICDP